VPASSHTGVSIEGLSPETLAWHAVLLCCCALIPSWFSPAPEKRLPDAELTHTYCSGLDHQSATPAAHIQVEIALPEEMGFLGLSPGLPAWPKVADTGEAKPDVRPMLSCPFVSMEPILRIREM